MKKSVLFLVICMIISCKQIRAQKKDEAPDVQKDIPKGPMAFFAELQAKALAEPFEGVRTENGKELDLFPIRSTGVSTQPIQEAAEKFLVGLTDEQLGRTKFAIDDDEWRTWCNVDNGIYTRQGISLKEMDPLQKEAAFHLMQASLSAKGLALSKDIMKTDQTLKELNYGSEAYDEELYFFTVMGNPSATEPWGWQIDGHHLVINYFVLGDQIVMSPVFMGGEPIITTTGKYKGNTLFQDEQNLGLAFMQSLPVNQQKMASLSTSKIKDNNQTEAFKDNAIVNYEGLPFAMLSDAHKLTLLLLVNQYINTLRDGHRQIKMEEIEAHLDNTWFAWVGQTDAEAVFYYRIHSPVVMIEFDHQRVVGVPNADHKLPSRNHIHTVVRTPNGNDYGKDLLRQHLATHPH